VLKRPVGVAVDCSGVRASSRIWACSARADLQATCSRADRNGGTLAASASCFRAAVGIGVLTASIVLRSMVLPFISA